MKFLNIFLLIFPVLFLIVVSTISENITYAQWTKFKARLTGDHEIPPVNTTAAGNAKLTFKGFKVKEDGMVSRINVTDITNVTAAKIYLGLNTEIGQPIVDLLSSAKQNKTTNALIIKTEIKPTDFEGSMSGKTMDDLKNEMIMGITYIDISTSEHPNGELRGQIKVSDTNTTLSAGNNIQPDPFKTRDRS